MGNSASRPVRIGAFAALLLPVMGATVISVSATARQSSASSNDIGRAMAGHISGHIYSSDTTQPIPNAVVSLSQAPVAGTFAEPIAVATDATGGYKFDDLAPGLYTVLVDGGAYFSSAHSGGINLAAGQSFDSVDVTLAPTGTISGTVITPEGVPVPDVFVQIVRPDSATDPFDGLPVKTDDEGFFRLGQLMPGDRKLAVAFTQFGKPVAYYPDATSETSGTVSITAGHETTGIQVKLMGLTETPSVSAQAHEPVSGRVLRSDNGGPVGKALVVLRDSAPAANGSPLYAITNSEGGFKFASVPPGDYNIAARASRFMSASSPFSIQIIHVTSSPVSGVQVRLRSAAAIAGTVKDANGNPLWSESVTVFRKDSMRDVQAGTSLTDLAGHFRIVVPAPGDYYVKVEPPAMGGAAHVEYASKYYPNEDSEDTAKPIEAKPMASIPDVSFTLSQAPTFTVSVRVNGASDPSALYYFSITKTGTIQSPSGRGPAPSENHFLFRRGDTTVKFEVPSGIYTVTVRPAQVHQDASGRVTGASGDGSPIGTATAEVKDADLTVDIPVAQRPSANQASPR